MNDPVVPGWARMKKFQRQSSLKRVVNVNLGTVYDDLQSASRQLLGVRGYLHEGDNKVVLGGISCVVDKLGSALDGLLEALDEMKKLEAEGGEGNDG